MPCYKIDYKVMIKYDSSHDKYDCCGCRACEQVCPKQAIVMEADGEGFLYPKIDTNKCVNCGLCNKVCPIEVGNTSLEHPLEVYASQYQNDKILSKSSSGGIFSLVANYVFSKHGVVYGAAFDKGMYLQHIRITDKEKLSRLRGSKYVQSDIGNTYKQARKDLENGLLVYFTGTPCQIQGLKLFLRKHYDNLLTTDLVCHGTPSYKIFANTLREIEGKKHGRINSYLFRDKSVGGWSCSSSSSYNRIKDGKKVFLHRSNDMSAYFNAFISGNMMRYVCYQCPFADIHRVSDITLADCWGVDKIVPDFPNIKKGVSTILVNTQKGIMVWKNISDKTIYRQIPEADAIANNANLHHASILPEGRAACYDLAFNDYNKFLYKFSPSAKENINFYLKYYVKRIPIVGSLLTRIKDILK